MLYPTPHKYTAMVFCIGSVNASGAEHVCWVRLAGGLPTASCWIIVWTVASSFWHRSMTRHMDGWASLTRLKKLLFQPSHMLLVLASSLTVASCTFQMAGGNIGGLRVKTRRTAWFCAGFCCLSLPLKLNQSNLGAQLPLVGHQGIVF